MISYCSHMKNMTQCIIKIYRQQIKYKITIMKLDSDKFLK